MNNEGIRQGSSFFCAALLLFFGFGAPLRAQDTAPAPPPDAPQAAPAQPYTPEQLDDLVAPVALDPDPLLSEVLVASTYPLEVVEASQWLQQNQGLQGQQRMDAARQQNWDPSVQALAAFPDVLTQLASSVSWTTALGNAFLAQQGDVMSAVQRMRARAQANGRLNSDAEQNVTTQTQDGQTAIEIMPANPQVIYVPEYNPAYVWGPPAWGYYPDLYYPAVGFGYGFYPGIYLDTFFGGWGGWGGWGWRSNWFGSSIFLNTGFFDRYRFHNFYGEYGRGGIWSHNPYHRLGVPYPNARLGQRFGGNYIGRGGAVHAGVGIAAQRRGGFAGGQVRSGGNWQRFSGSTGAARGGSIGGGQLRGGGRSFAGSGGAWQRFSGSGGAPRNGAVGGANRIAPQGQSFGRGSSQSVGAGRSFGAAPAYRSPAAGGSRGFSGSQPSFRPSGGGARSFGGAARSFSGGGGRSFNGGSSQSFSGARSFGGGGSRSFSGGAARSFGGGGARSFSGGGSRSFSGGGARSFGGGGSRSFGGGGSHGGGGGGFHGGGGGSRGAGGGHGGRR